MLQKSEYLPLEITNRIKFDDFSPQQKTPLQRDVRTTLCFRFLFVCQRQIEFCLRIKPDNPLLVAVAEPGRSLVKFLVKLSVSDTVKLLLDLCLSFVNIIWLNRF